MGLAGLWGGSWPSAPALTPAHAASAVNDALGSLIGAKCLPGLLSAGTGSRLPCGTSWRNVPSFLLPVIQGLPSGDRPGGGDLCHSQHPGCLGHRLFPATQWGRDHCGRQDQEAVWCRGDPLPCRGGKGSAGLAGPSQSGRKRAHAVLSRPWGRYGVSSALIHRPTGCLSAPPAACQPRVAACHVTPSGFPPSTPPRRIASHFSPAVTRCHQVV